MTKITTIITIFFLTMFTACSVDSEGIFGDGGTFITEGGSNAGAGGEGGSAGQGGFAGQGGSTTDSGTDTSTTTPPYSTCIAEGEGRITTYTVGGDSLLGSLLSLPEGNEYYNSSKSYTQGFEGVDLPGQLVVAAKDSIAFILKGDSPKPVKFFTVSGVMPEAQCGGASGYMRQECLSLIAKAYRCSHNGLFGEDNCPEPGIIFTEQPATLQYSNFQTGWQLFLIPLDCP